MSKKEKRDPIEQLKEWEDHMYNPGYWFNRSNPFYPPRNELGSRKLALIYMLVLAPLTGLFIIFFLLEPSTHLITPLVILLLLLTLTGINYWRLGRHKRNFKNK